MGRDPRGKADSGWWERLDAGPQWRTGFSAVITRTVGSMAADIKGGQLWLQFSQLNRRQNCLMGVALDMEQRLGASKAGRSGLEGPRLLSAASLGLCTHLLTCSLGQVDTPKHRTCYGLRCVPAQIHMLKP